MKNLILASKMLIIASFFNPALQAQNKVPDELYIIKGDSISIQTGHSANAASTNLIPSGVEILQPLQSIGGIEFPDPERNFIPPISEIRSGGDLDGDGIDDLYFVVSAGDETTVELEDRVSKMELFFSSDSGLDGSGSVIIRDGFIFIADLDNDGISDAIKTSDGKIILVKDNSNGEFSNLSETVLLEADITGAQIASYGDFDGDGFDDVIIFRSQPNRSQDVNFFVVYGAASVEEVTVGTLTYTPEGSSGIDEIMYADINGDGLTEVVRYSVVSGASHPGFITVYRMNEAGSLLQIDQQPLSESVIKSGPISFTFGPAALMDLNNDGSLELIIKSDNEVRIFLLSETQGVFYSEQNILSTVFQADNFSIIGDYNGDGLPDLLLKFGNKLKFIAGNVNLELAEINLELTDDEVPTLLRSKRKKINSAGDINADGFDDIVVVVSKNSRIQFQAYHGNASGTFDTASEIIFSGSENAQLLEGTFNAGDLNGDGIEDFGILYQRTAEIYFGGSDLNEPDLVIKAPATSGIGFSWAPTSGDFNGDGYSDIVLNVFDFNGTGLQGLYFFFGGTAMDNNPDHQILLMETFPELNDVANSGAGFRAFRNIGDLNGDGIDDLIFSHDTAPFVESFILFGSSSLSNIPDLTLNRHGTNFVKLGDFNSDGKNDIAVYSARNFEITVYIYSGFNSLTGESFSAEPLLSIQALQAFFGLKMDSGDFDGDGNNDLIISSFNHRDSNFNGTDAFYIYKGGPDADSEADYSFPLKNSFIAGFFNNLGDINATNSLGEITMLPDLNGDGTDEILFTPDGVNHTNSVIYFGNKDITAIGEDPDIVLQSPNQRLFLTNRTSFINAQNVHSAVGDFNGNGKVNFVLPQSHDWNFLRSNSYLFEASVSPLIFVNKTETVSAGGGTVEDENTGARITIPAGALNTDTEIEMGTFSSVPEGADVAGIMVFLGPAGTTFNEPVEVTVTYNPEELPDGLLESELSLVRYNQETNDWDQLDSNVDTINKTVTGFTDHFSGFAAGRVQLTTSAEDEVFNSRPESFILKQNYPNPFNPSTVIEFSIPQSSAVRLEIFNVVGQRVAMLINDQLNAGTHTVNFDASNLASGLYIYRLTAGNFVQTKKLTLIK